MLLITYPLKGRRLGLNSERIKNMMTNNIEDSPRYMKALQKMARLNPAQKAVFDAGLVHAQFADENMRKYLTGMRDAATNLNRQRSLGLSKEAFAAETSLGNQARDLREKDSRTAEIIAAGGAATDIVHGYQDLQNKKALANKYQGLGRYLYQGI